MDDRLAILNAVLRFLQGFQEADPLMQEGLALIAELTGWAGVALVTPGQDTTSVGRVYVEAAAGTLAASHHTMLPLDADAITAVVHDHVTRCLPDAETGGAALLVPLKRGERVYLCLYVVDIQPGLCDDAARTLAETLAESLALSLQNVHFYETLQYEVAVRRHVEDRYWAAIYKIETLYRVSRSLISPKHLDDILKTVVNNIAGVLRADRVVLLRGTSLLDNSCDARQSVVVVSDGAEEVSAALHLDCVLVGVGGAALRDGRPVFLSKDAVRARLSQSGESLYVDGQDGSVAMAPLFLHDEAIGALVALNRSAQRDFVQQDVDLLMAAAAQLVAAMRSAQLFQEVAGERERLSAVVNSSRDGVMLLDGTLRLLVVNKPALRLLGIVGEPEAWVNRSAWDVLRSFRDYARHAVRVALAEMRLVRSGDIQPREDEIKIGLRIVRWVSLPVRGSAPVLGRLIIFRDVTEARMVEQFRDDLTHTMVHDLRNPLTGIHAALSLLSRNAAGRLLSAQREVLDIAFKSTQRMLKLVNAILDISRLESGQMPLSRSVFRLSDVVDELEEFEKPLIETSQLTFVNAVTQNVPLVWADRELVERVMQNLVGNALKFTPAGGEVRVSAGIEPERPRKLHISITDTGSGIPPEIRDTLFTKFVIGPQEERGNGLGLAFCQMALEAHGERIWVADTSEAGTTFTFTLPLASTAPI